MIGVLFILLVPYRRKLSCDAVGGEILLSDYSVLLHKSHTVLFGNSSIPMPGGIDSYVSGDKSTTKTGMKPIFTKPVENAHSYPAHQSSWSTAVQTIFISLSDAGEGYL